MAMKCERKIERERKGREKAKPRKTKDNADRGIFKRNRGKERVSGKRAVLALIKR